MSRLQAATLLLAAGALLALSGAGCAVGSQLACPDGMAPFTELNIYFGQEKGDGTTVSEDEWQAFLQDTVTQRFPDGLTVTDAYGQWFDTANGRLYQESTKLLNVLVPVDVTDASLDAARAISERYQERFDQQAVFRTALPACAEIS